MESLWILLFVLGLGFVTAGLVSTMHHTLVGENMDFRLSFANPLLAVWSLLVCVFAGPYVVIKNAMVFWINGAISSAILLICATISAFWSFCSGILLMQTLQSTGLIHLV